MNVVQASKISNTVLHVFCIHDINLYMRTFNAYVSPLMEYCYEWLTLLYCDINLIENVKRILSSYSSGE